MTIATSRGFAILTDDGIDIRTVCETRRAAIVNWLVAERQKFIFKWHTDPDIKQLWDEEKGTAQVVPVSVQAVLQAEGGS